jgi:AraC-like DNA-binding protein
MKLHKIPAPDHLKQYVQFFWYAEGESASFYAIADGCPGIIFSRTENGMVQGDKKLSPFFLYGQTTRLTELTANGKFQLTGLCFYPHVIKVLFGLDAHELTDDCLDINTFLTGKKQNPGDHLMNTGIPLKRIEIISNYVYGLIQSSRQNEDELVVSALSAMIKSVGEISLRELHKTFNVTERTFERRFEKHVGIPPKLFSRICRFQASLNQLKDQQYNKLSDIAYENGFTDQSHFIRTFKEFTGHSPNKFQRTFLQPISNAPVFTR